MGSAIYFIRHCSDPSLCQIQRPYNIILSRQEKPHSKEIRPRVSRRRKHGDRGLGTRDWKLASRELGREMRESRGRGLSVHFITRMDFVQCSFYYFNLSIIFKAVFRRMSLHALLRKQLLQTLDPDLPLKLCSLTVLGMSVPSSEGPLYLHRFCGVVLLLSLLLPELSLWSRTEDSARSAKVRIR